MIYWQLCHFGTMMCQMREIWVVLTLCWDTPSLPETQRVLLQFEDKFFIDRRFAIIRLPLWDEIGKIYQYYLLIWEVLLSSPENHIAMRIREEKRRTSGTMCLVSHCFCYATHKMRLYWSFLVRRQLSNIMEVRWLHVSSVNVYMCNIRDAGIFGRFLYS